ncbi:YcaO-like family protein [Embleya sp. NBC_00888]|uniref:YcaO-like family protein n=1 Tax=Embleya sp. NBC_00888 TaxID=2975960 RepID=UPI00386F19EE|nr:YcaO-like family protein [Embleya sp. NBC_00888]
MFTPYGHTPDVVIARIAARSPQFDAVCASGDRPILVGSAAGHRREQVVLSARGELLERVGNILAGRAAEADAATVASYAELRRKGVPALDPAESAPDGSAPPDTARTTRRLWVLGHLADSGEEIHVPAGAAFLQHRPPAGCAPGPGVGSTGVAAHPDPDAAADHAAWEVLERDLIRRSWYGPAAAPTPLPTGELPGPLAELLRALDLTATGLDLPAPSGTRCVVVCLHAADGSGQTFGARCGPDRAVSTLIEKAAYEALMVRWSMGSAVAVDTWDRWRGSGPPQTAVQHALWAYHRQDSLRLWTDGTAARSSGGAASMSGRLGSGSEWPGSGSGWASDSGSRSDSDSDSDSDSGSRSRSGFGAAGASTPAEQPARTPVGTVGAFGSRPGLAALSAHTGRDVVIVDTTAGPARTRGTTVIRVVAPGARALPNGPSAERHFQTVPGPHPFG